MKTLNLLILTAALGCTWVSTAIAHGNQAHGKAAHAVKKEQKDWGIAGDAKKIKRTIQIRMLDTMRFSPEKITVKQGETIKFVIKNTGAVLHEFVIGTKKENEEHAALMLKFPNMEHSEPYMAHVPPGKTGQIVWTFNQPGEFEFACLIAGHYQAGMRGSITLSALGKSAAAAAPKSATASAPSAPQATRAASTAPAVAAPVTAAPAVSVAPTSPLATPAKEAPPKAIPATDMAKAEIRKIDLDTKKITLKHGPIKNLDMPGMTMVFQVRDAALFNNLAVGDKIMFTAEQLQGAMVMTRVEKQIGTK
jgi:uncharacterized cupredoxin-like copper-binding protein/Cu/Ag efflux protein CusF